MIVIVGAGLAGDSAAATLRAEGYAGRIVMIGEEPHRPYDRPPLSKGLLTGESPEESVFLRPPGFYEEQGIELLLGTPATAIDSAARSVTLADGDVLIYDKLLLATGSQARTLPGAAKVPVFLVRTLDDARALQALLQPGRRIGVIGAGVIGLEVAASAASRGCAVDVFELADRVLARVAPPAISAYMAALHEANGVRLHLSAGGVTLLPAGIASAAHGEFPVDGIVIGIGVMPNTALAEAAGITCDDGILVDRFGRTGAEHVYAVGDAARYPCPFTGAAIRCENWKHAQNHAAVAARHMLGGEAAYDTASSMWTDQYDVKLQTVGHVGDGEPITRGDPAGRKFMLLWRDAEGRVAGAVGINQAKDMRFAQTLIEKRAPVDAALLADPATDLRKLAQHID